MTRKLLVLALALAIGLSFMPRSASAAAYGAPWAVSLTYQNVGSTSATIVIDFYPENNGTAITFSPPQLPAGAGTSLSIGSVTAVPAGFKGSAVLSSNENVIATIVQVASGIPNRPLSNGFSASDAAAQQLVATVLKTNYRTVFSVQNTESGPIDVTVKFYAVGASTPTHTATALNLPKGAAKYFDAGTIAQLPNGFSGSAVVTAKLAGTQTDGKVVVTVNELQVDANGSAAFEGTARSGAKVYMPSALCKFAGLFSAAYAIQNASQTANVSFRVVYKRSGQADIVDGPYTLTPGGKRSIQNCARLPEGGIGSAVIERTGGTGTLVAVGKVFGGNISSAFLGTIEGNGSSKIALPYIRWSPDSTFGPGQRQRAFIAVQNIGTGNATNVRVEYRDRTGALKGTHTLGTILPGEKKNSNASLAPGALDGCGRFGEYGDCPAGNQFGGSAIVLADGGAQLAVVVRIQTGIPTQAGEDYTGINVP